MKTLTTVRNLLSAVLFVAGLCLLALPALARIDTETNDWMGENRFEHPVRFTRGFTLPAGAAASIAGTLTVGATGTALSLFNAGTIDINNGATTASLAVAGAAAGDLAFVSFAESPGSAATVFGTVSANTLTVTVDADPGTTLTCNWMLLRKP